MGEVMNMKDIRPPIPEFVIETKKRNKDGEVYYVYDINYDKLSDYLYVEGFRTYKRQLVRIQKEQDRAVHVVERIEDPSDAYNHAALYVKSFGNELISDKFLRSRTSILNSGILPILPELGLEEIADTKEESYFFFKNVLVKVEGKEEFTQIPYKEIPKGAFVWKSKILDREFRNATEVNGDFESFVKNLAGQDQETFHAICSALGYLLHRFKPGATKCILVQDVNRDNDGEPEGRNGKSLLMEAVGQFRKLIRVDGKHFDSTNRFAFQSIPLDADIWVVDDAKRDFDLESLFSALTEGVTIERKNRDPIVLSHEESPKMAVTTNYTIRGESSSFRGRRQDIFISNHYNAENTPEDEFGRRFWDQGWYSEDWAQFDDFMLRCVSVYLSEGLISQVLTEDMKLKRLKWATDPAFLDVIEEHSFNIPAVYHHLSLLHDLIQREGGKKISYQRLRVFLYKYATYKGWELDTGVKRYSQEFIRPREYTSGEKGTYFRFSLCHT